MKNEFGKPFVGTGTGGDVGERQPVATGNLGPRLNTQNLPKPRTPEHDKLTNLKEQANLFKQAYHTGKLDGLRFVTGRDHHEPDELEFVCRCLAIDYEAFLEERRVLDEWLKQVHQTIHGG